MKKKNLEAFDNFEVEPSREVWNRIETNLPKAKKRRWFLWIFPIMIAVVAGWQFILKDFMRPSSPENKIEIPVVNQQLNSRSGDIDKTISSDVTKQNNRSDGVVNNIKSSATKSNVGAKNNLTAANFSSVNNKKQVGFVTAVTLVESQERNENNLAEEEVVKLEGVNFSLEDTYSENDIVKKNITVSKESILSRWTIFAGSGIMYSNSHYKTNTSVESANNITSGIKNIYFDIGVGYDLTHRFRLSSGISYRKAGQEQSSLTKIYLHGPPGDPNNTYSFTTGVGNLTGSGSEFDRVYFDSPDSTLFSPYTQLTPQQDVAKDTYFSLREEFYYIQMPIEIIYKPVERKFTPYAGIYFSAAYLVKETVILNDQRISYQYKNGLSDFLFSAGITAGVDYRLSRTLSIFVNGFYQEGLNSVIIGNSWKPYMTGVGGGFRYRMLK